VSIIGEIIRQEMTPAIEKQTIEVTTDDIEDMIRSRYAKGGWDVSFDWQGSQWPKLVVSRSREAQA
jgi:hypothetical protein